MFKDLAHMELALEHARNLSMSCSHLSLSTCVPARPLVVQFLSTAARKVAADGPSVRRLQSLGRTRWKSCLLASASIWLITGCSSHFASQPEDQKLSLFVPLHNLTFQIKFKINLKNLLKIFVTLKLLLTSLSCFAKIFATIILPTSTRVLLSL